jgi:hypothetical protein
MRAKPTCAVALTAVAVLIGAIADAAAAPRPSRPVDAGPDCLVLEPVHHPDRLHNICTGLGGWGQPALVPPRTPRPPIADLGHGFAGNRGLRR